MRHLDRFLSHIHAKGKHDNPEEHQHSQAQTQPHPQPPTPAPAPDTAVAGPPQIPPLFNNNHHVFAHFIIGNAYYMTPAQWESDIVEAKKAHIDGFALNIAPQDHHTERALQAAYDAADKIGGFSLFISFDYESGGPWPLDRVISLINTYKPRGAQFHYDGKPLVSTFEGPGNAGDWPSIKAATGCMFIPCWTSMGPEGISRVLHTVDGAFSWDAWPVGAEDKSTASDEAWMGALAGKPYMMPVAPWFYTNLPQWNKNWLWRGDDLWHYRWKQVIELQPPLVQILSWNDYGEAHYIGPVYGQGVPDGASRYVSDHPHDAWRALLPHYIDAYRQNIARAHGNGANAVSANPQVSSRDKIVYWYRRNPGRAGSADGTTGNNPTMGQKPMDPSELAQDRVFVSVFVTEPSETHVQIGSGPHSVLDAAAPGVNHGSCPFNGQTGPVKISILRGGREVVSTVGPEISDQCAGGIVDWNAYVGASE
ncbi:mutanase [Aspergillus ambiguus]|uniref:glycoside hydrolase family 71 protein n=1 Tax=Aspergillus ambiguus TaxID=176160 RepID=UPI003CCD01D4